LDERQQYLTKPSQIQNLGRRIKLKTNFENPISILIEENDGRTLEFNLKTKLHLCIAFRELVQIKKI